jgi:hypothetical protein
METKSSGVPVGENQTLWVGDPVQRKAEFGTDVDESQRVALWTHATCSISMKVGIGVSNL